MILTSKTELLADNEITVLKNWKSLIQYTIIMDEMKKKNSFILGSSNYPFKLCIIGAGPAGCSLIVRAIRLGIINKIW